MLFEFKIHPPLDDFIFIFKDMHEIYRDAMPNTETNNYISRMLWVGEIETEIIINIYEAMLYFYSIQHAA
jgi:hypothetical protein